MTTDNPIIIIGTGLAGYNLAKEFRKISQAPLVMFTQDDGHFYSKPMLSTAIQNNKDAGSLVITPVETMRQQLQAEIHTFTTVCGIDFESKVLTYQSTHGKNIQKFSQLVFAMGANPKPFPLFDTIAHHRVNNLIEYDYFRQAIDNAQSVAIVGSGLVGCEFAHDISNLGKTIHIVSPDQTALNQIVPGCIGQAFQEALQNKGVNWHLGTSIESVTSDKQFFLTNGKLFSVDLILLAIGLIPNIKLAKDSGININQGIVVNEFLQTNHPNAFALGDCAEIQGSCRQYIAPIMQCARTLAKTLCGQFTPVSLPELPISVKTLHYPIIASPPVQNRLGEWRYEIYPDGINAQFIDNQGLLGGYALSGKQIEQRQRLGSLLNKAPDTII